jgi:hypothetical protein
MAARTPVPVEARGVGGGHMKAQVRELSRDWSISGAVVARRLQRCCSTCGPQPEKKDLDRVLQDSGDVLVGA